MYRTIGGLLDLYLFLGPGPEDKIGKEVAGFQSRGALDIDTNMEASVGLCYVCF